MTTADYLESLQDDLDRTVTALDLDEGTNFTDIADMAENGDISTGGGSSIDENADVIFFDYDGTVTNSYSKSDFLNLITLPPLPTHEGLISQGWTWNLTDAQEFVRSHGSLHIGNNYNTDDQSTRIHITVTDETLSPYLYFSINGTATIDWGDNSTPEIVTGNGNGAYYGHVYSLPGKYIIRLTSDNDITLEGSSYHSIIAATNTGYNDTNNQLYCTIVDEVNCYSNIILGNSAFRYCINLKSISLPQTTTFDISGFYVCDYCVSLKSFSISDITYIRERAFENCRALKFVSLPKVYGMGQSVFNLCVSLKNIELPELLSTSQSIFQNAYNLEKIIISKVRSEVSANSFAGPLNIQYIDFSEATAVPNLRNANALSGLNLYNYKIIVPDNLYDSWKTYGNWSSIKSNHFIKKSDWDALN